VTSEEATTLTVESETAFTQRTVDKHQGQRSVEILRASRMGDC
jgi:hypothetical protein